MHYNVQKLLGLTLLFLLMFKGNAFSQENENVNVSETSTSTTTEVAPGVTMEQNSLFDDEETSGMITPPSEKVMVEVESNATIPVDEMEKSINTDITIDGQKVGSRLADDEELANTLGDAVLRKIDNDLFSQMSDLEKQTALLTLELRREKIRSEIEALKIQRKKAQEEELLVKEEKERKKIEWEKEQERKLLEEQQKLIQLEMTLEKLKQAKILNAYKENMLQENLEWISNNDKIYQEIIHEENMRKEITEDFKNKLKQLAEISSELNIDTKAAKEFFDKEMNAMKTQVGVLKARLEAAETERREFKANPFADEEVSLLILEALTEKEARLSDEYTVMEIKGQGDNISAKLMNKEGMYFTVKKGTALNTGHIIDEITRTYVRADRKGEKDFIYFASGGVIEQEPKAEIERQVKESTAKLKEKLMNSLKRRSNRGGELKDAIPSLGSGMFAK